jgi:hypothetical protein
MESRGSGKGLLLSIHTSPRYIQAIPDFLQLGLAGFMVEYDISLWSASGCFDGRGVNDVSGDS